MFHSWLLKELRDIGISAVIVSDPALIEICATEAPGLPIHLSTQASATNYETHCSMNKGFNLNVRIFTNRCNFLH
jgi:collagenase-like PrtC family protease